MKVVKLIKNKSADGSEKVIGATVLDSETGMIAKSAIQYYTIL